MGQCPSGFAPYVGGCVRTCPNNQQFFLLTENNQPRCAYKPDPTKFVNLTPVGLMPFRGFDKPPMTLDELKTAEPEQHTTIINESKRVDTEIEILLKDIDKKKQIADAFKRLQDAEDIRDKLPEAYQAARVEYYTLTKGPEWVSGETDRVAKVEAFKRLQAAEDTRDQDPETYQAARVAYYTLINGPRWVDGETARIAKVEADPEIQRYEATYKNVMDRKSAQQRVQDVMKSVSDGVISLKDDVQYTTKTFQDQIGKLKNQINIERRGRETPDDEDNSFFKWVDMLLNVFIVAGLLFAGYTIWKKVSAPKPMAYVPLAPTFQ